ncbi:MAG: class I SAM-dependent methyltransferase [Candidatus Kariarchaeaceae archaeon]|jgi:SAM-dependent methyltransferase
MENLVESTQIKRDQGIGKFFDSQGLTDIKPVSFDSLPKSARMHIESIQEVNPKSAIDVGCGAGDILLGIASNGLEAVYGIDLSKESLILAEKRVEKFGNVERAQFFQENFASMDPIEVDGVSFHRSLCCHPDLEGMLKQSLACNPQVIAITVPRNRFYVKGLFGIARGFFKIARKEFRPYVHSQRLIDEKLHAANYQKTQQKKGFFWEVSIYRRK